MIFEKTIFKRIFFHLNCQMPNFSKSFQIITFLGPNRKFKNRALNIFEMLEISKITFALPTNLRTFFANPVVLKHRGEVSRTEISRTLLR